MTRQNRIHARPTSVSRPAPTGLQPLELGSVRDSYLYVPKGYRFTEPSALLLMLHGSGGHAHHGVDLLQQLADKAGIILVAPASTQYTWDESQLRYGTDIRIINKALEYVFRQYAVDPSHLAVGGFSDGASAAISLGLGNSHLFTHVIALSPRFVVSTEPARSNHPRVFIACGMRDELMPLSTCAQKIARPLEAAGLDVEYVEFEVGHRIPPHIARQAIEWFTAEPESAPEQFHASPPRILARQGG